jgi:hypothetical protein
MTTIIVKNFTPHYNSALGKVVRNEREYKEEMKRGGYIEYERAQEITAHNLEKRNKFDVSEKAMDWMRDVKSSSDKKGNIKMSDRQIEAMNKIGKTASRESEAFKSAQAHFDGTEARHFCR